MRTTLNTVYGMIENNLNKITSDMAKINSQIISKIHSAIEFTQRMN